jgi:hypothetical protein
VPARTVVVGAGGTPAENGAALRAALAGLPAASEDDPRAVVLGAGRYDLAGTGVSVPADVTLAGAGATATIVESSPSNVQLDVVKLGVRSGLRDLTVRTGSSALGSVGINGTDGHDPLVERVIVEAGTGAIVRGGTLRDVDITARITGVRALEGGGQQSLLVIDGAKVATINTGLTRAVWASTAITVLGSRLFAASAEGGATGLLYNATNGVSTIRGSAIEVTAGGLARGVFVDTVGAGPRVEVDASSVEVQGPNSSALVASIGGIRSGASQLTATNTATESNGGQVTCFGTYTGAYAAAAC